MNEKKFFEDLMYFKYLLISNKLVTPDLFFDHLKFEKEVKNFISNTTWKLFNINELSDEDKDLFNMEVNNKIQDIINCHNEGAISGNNELFISNHISSCEADYVVILEHFSSLKNSFNRITSDKTLYLNDFIDLEDYIYKLARDQEDKTNYNNNNKELFHTEIILNENEKYAVYINFNTQFFLDKILKIENQLKRIIK